MTIRVVVEQYPDRWDEFIQAFPSSGPFHTRAWTECFRDERLTPVYLRLLSGAHPIGGIAGVIVNPKHAALRSIDRKASFFTGPALQSMDGDSIREALLAVKSYAADEGLTSLISSARDYPYAYDWGSSRVHLQILHEYIVDLSEPWGQVKQRMRRSIPKQARKAERAGLVFEERRDASMFPDLLRLLEHTRLRRKEKSGVWFSSYYLPHLGARPLAGLARSSLARFFVARKGADVLCIMLAFAFNKRAYALLIGCSEEGYALWAPAFTLFNSIRNLSEGGIESLNLAGAGPESKLAYTKSSLGAERRRCTGCVSPYLQGHFRNLLFQAYRWLDTLSARVSVTQGKSLHGR